MRVLPKRVRAPEESPEGNGTMMDSTLIVPARYNTDKLNANGASWSHMIRGNFGGAMQKGLCVKIHLIEYPLTLFE